MEFFKRLKQELKHLTIKTDLTLDEILEQLKNNGVHDLDVNYYINYDILTAYSSSEFEERLVNACVLEALQEIAIDIDKLYYYYLKTNLRTDTTIIETKNGDVVFFMEPLKQELLQIVSIDDLSAVIL